MHLTPEEILNNPSLITGIQPSGCYAYQVTLEAAAAHLRQMEPKLDPSHLALQAKENAESQTLPLIYGVDPNDLAQAGWGVIFPEDRVSDLKPLVETLLKRRREQAGALYREFTCPRNQTALDFLEKQRGSQVVVDPSRVPFHLLIVGDPRDLSFDFQSDLAVPHSVGRLWFDDPNHFEPAIQNILRAEDRAPRRPSMRLWGPNHDACTALSRQYLVEGLSTDLQQTWGAKADINHSRQTATQAELLQWLRGPQKSDLLFTASHGLSCREMHPDFERYQGSLICGDWPGPSEPPQPLRSGDYLAAAHLQDEDDLGGCLMFLFGCFTGGCPEFNTFPDPPGSLSQRLWKKPFVGALPTRLMSLPKGAAGVVGHIDCSYFWSFTNLDHQPQTQLYRDCFNRLLAGEPIGLALQTFSLNYALKTIQYREQIRTETKYGSDPSPAADTRLVNLWTSAFDSRYFLLLGDPALRLPIET